MSNPPKPKPVEEEVLWIHPDQIDEDPKNARRTYDEAALRELGESMKVKQMQNAGVQRAGDRFKLVWGHRRKRAAKLGGILLKCVVTKYKTEREAFMAQLEENALFEALTPYEQAIAMQRALELGVPKMELPGLFKKSYNTIKSRLEILEFPTQLAEQVDRSGFSLAHAKALLPLAQSPKALQVALKTIGVGSPNGVHLSVVALGDFLAPELVRKGVAFDVAKAIPAAVRDDKAIWGEVRKLGVAEFRDNVGRTVVLAVDEAKFKEALPRWREKAKRLRAGQDSRRDAKREESQKLQKRHEARRAADAKHFEEVEGLARREMMAALQKRFKTASDEEILRLQLQLVDEQDLNGDAIRLTCKLASVDEPAFLRELAQEADAAGEHEELPPHDDLVEALTQEWAPRSAPVRLRLVAGLHVFGSVIADPTWRGRQILQAMTGKDVNAWHAAAEKALKAAKANGKGKRARRIDDEDQDVKPKPSKPDIISHGRGWVHDAGGVQEAKCPKCQAMKKTKDAEIPIGVRAAVPTRTRIEPADVPVIQARIDQDRQRTKGLPVDQVLPAELELVTPSAKEPAPAQLDVVATAGPVALLRAPTKRMVRATAAPAHLRALQAAAAEASGSAKATEGGSE